MRAGGAIVNVTSGGADLPKPPGPDFQLSPGRTYVGYGITKAAVMHMTRMLAIEWAEHGIRVNTIAPGTVLTATRKEYADAHPGYLDKMIERVPLKRTCMPEEIADAAVYLASPAASYITGQTLLLDGGLTSY